MTDSHAVYKAGTKTTNGVGVTPTYLSGLPAGEANDDDIAIADFMANAGSPVVASTMTSLSIPGTTAGQLVFYNDSLFVWT